MIFFKKKDEVLHPYTIEQCADCKNMAKRKFKEGDFVFKISTKCYSCKTGQMMITKIFGEASN
jgi:hypothetical protein